MKRYLLRNSVGVVVFCCRVVVIVLPFLVGRNGPLDRPEFLSNNFARFQIRWIERGSGSTGNGAQGDRG
jgi:hypothetical protein